MSTAHDEEARTESVHHTSLRASRWPSVSDPGSDDGGGSAGRPEVRLFGAAVVATLAVSCSAAPPAPPGHVSPRTSGADGVATAGAGSAPAPVPSTVHSPTPLPTHTPAGIPTSEPGNPGDTVVTALPDAAGPGCVTQTLARMDRTARVAQLLMVAVTPGQPDPPAPGNRPGSLGGYLLLGGWRGAAVVSARTRAWQRKAAGGVAPLVAADQEGGRVQQLRGEGFTSLPTGLAQGRLRSSDLTRLLTRVGRELAGAGVSVNLAPVADTVPTSMGTRNAPIGRSARQFGSDPAAVARTVTTAVQAIQAGRVAATVKHFPGLGRIRGNTDVTAVGITDTRTDASDGYLQPFRAGIAAGAHLVMVSSARYPRLDPNRQAVFSPAVIDGLLRGRLGYRGVVISDDLGAARAVAGVPTGQRAVRFVSAGGDLVITVRFGDVRPMASALLAAAGRDPRLARRIDASALRVLTLKAQLGLLRCSSRPA